MNNKNYLVIAPVVIIVFLLGFVLFAKSPSSKDVQSLTNPPQNPTPILTPVSDPSSSNEVLSASTSADKMTPMQYSSAPQMEIDKEKTYTAVLHTDEGDITVQLNAKDTPITVNNFVFLAKNNFYNNTIFHRVIKGFMIQGGDPEGTGRGGPGYRFNDEPFTGEYTRGTIAMANAGPNTNGSQFFIMHKDTPLPKDYVIFGKVTSGIEVVDKIASAPTQSGGEGSTPVSPVHIKTVEIEEK